MLLLPGMIVIKTEPDSLEFEMLENYCLAKSYLWNMFFGWRGTHKRMSDTHWNAYYIINKKDYTKIMKSLKKMLETYDLIKES